MKKEITDELQFIKEQESNIEIDVYTMSDIKFEVQTSDQTVRAYIQDVIGPHSQEKELEAQKNYRIIPIRSSYDVLSRFEQKEVMESQSSYEYGKLDSDIYYLSSPLGFTNITHVTEELTSHYIFSPRPELGAVSFIRTELLKSHYDEPSFLVFHAASMISEDGSMSVFSGIESIKAYGNRAGKTTALLAAIIKENPKYKFFSNDEVATIIKDGKVEVLPFPNQIPVREGTLKGILNEGVKIPTDFLVDKDKQSGESIYYTTPGQIKRTGYSVANEKPTSVKNWIFTNLDPQQVGNSIVQITNEQSLEMFRTSVFPRRMNQAKNKGYQGELYRNYSTGQEDYEKADKTHEALVEAGTRFFILSRGVDRASLQSAIESIDLA